MLLRPCVHGFLKISRKACEREPYDQIEKRYQDSKTEIVEVCRRKKLIGAAELHDCDQGNQRGILK